MADFEEQTASVKLSDFIGRNKKCFIAVLVVFVCLLIGFIAGASIKASNNEKGLQALDEITFEMTDKSSDIEEAEIATRLSTAFEKAVPYTGKSGIVGARANMLCADITFQQKKFEESAAFWKAAADKAKKSYIAPISYFNLAVCYEELGKLDDAAANYKIAADNVNFTLRTHAMFSYGRILETQGKYAEAEAAYKEIDSNFPDNSWAELAKSRVIALQNEGKAE